MNTTPEIRANYRELESSEWTLDEHHYDHFTSSIEVLEEVQTRFRKGQISLREIKQLGWVIDWVSGNVKDIAERLQEEEWSKL